jgi:predicted dehydrogenase
MNVAIVGCGLIGRRRALVASGDPRSRVRFVVDTEASRANALASDTGAEAHTDWRAVIGKAADAVVVCTPSDKLHEIGTAALEAGQHVLLEKPMGRNVAEAEALSSTARQTDCVLKVGFNHRYHPALRDAHALAAGGAIGRIINIRARYGHGARPGYEQEWRCDPEVAGGGQLIDQGVHLADLIQWFLGEPESAFAVLQTAVWPIAPLEDNAFGLFSFASSAVAQVHVSTTQWKNLFSFEVFGELGSVCVEGLGGSYGPERLIIARRNLAGGAPDITERRFDGPDCSWSLEWDDFMSAPDDMSTSRAALADGVRAMRMIDALYRSGRTGQKVAY